MVANRFRRLLDRRISPEGNGCLVKIYPTGGVGGLIELGTERVVIGRDPTCDLVLSDQSVSRQHAAIELTGYNYTATDLHSTNGTFINDRQIDEAMIRAGDRIRMGNHILKFLSADDIEAQYHETAYMLMTTDGLTSVYNKRYLLDILEHELARSRRHRRPLSLLMIDIDDFKSVNDTYGHLAGDEVLQELCRRVRSVLSEDEIFARFGGEEFAVVMGEATAEYARKVAQRLRETVEQQTFGSGGRKIPLTVSIGIAETRGEREMTPSELIEQADVKLYEAKNSGRNCIVD